LRDTPKRATYLYLQLTLAFSAVVWLFIIWSGHLEMGFGLMIPAIMWCPAIAALVSCRLLGREFSSLAWHWPDKRYVAIAYLLPLAYASIAYGVVWAWGLGGWNSEFVSAVAQDFGLHGLPAWGSFTLYVVSMATGGMVLNLSLALGEEIGWRGFLVPELAKQMSFTKVSLLSGMVWAAWHSPLLLFTDYGGGTNRWYALSCSSVTVISVSFIFAWLRLKSDSLWPAALLHASHNLFVPGVFDHLIRDTGPTLWYTTQFGVALAVAGSVFAMYFWTRRTEVQPAVAKNVSARAAAFG
jgi:membrane protease YdiL (CAAX protease family)